MWRVSLLFSAVFLAFNYFSMNKSYVVSDHSEISHHANITSHFRSSIIGGVLTYPKPFFIKIVFLTRRSTKFCGGTTINPNWVVTSAFCVHAEDPTKTMLEVGDFTVPLKERISKMAYFYVDSWFIHENFTSNGAHHYDIALIRVTRPIKLPYYLPLCQPVTAPSTSLFGSCGLGSELPAIFRITPSYPETLRETQFAQGNFLRFNLFNMDLQLCPEYNICTMPFFTGASICVNDIGNPLYKYQCGTFTPECLYGVGSYYHMDEVEECRNVGSVFTSIPFFYEWIQNTIKIEEFKKTYMNSLKTQRNTLNQRHN